MAELRRVLGFNTLLLITVNAIIGSGLFFLPAIGAAYAGPASIISWIILSAMALYLSMCFAELVSMYPKAGGLYEFSKHSFGRFWSFIFGWTAYLVGNVTTAMLIVGAIQYLLPYDSLQLKLAKLIVCLFLIWVFNILAYRGMQTSAIMLVTFAIITISLVVLLIIAGAGYVHLSNYRPFFLYSSVWKNLKSIFIAIFFIAETFFGLESVAYLSEETKDPQKTIPKAIIYATILIALLTITLVTVSLGVIPWTVFANSSAPFALMGKYVWHGIFETFIVLGTYLVIIGAAAGWIITSPRLIMALTRDKLFFPAFSYIHPKYHTPSKAILLQGILSSLFVTLSFGGGYKALLSLLVPLVLIMQSAILLSIPILRHKEPRKKRYFKVPFGNVGPFILLIINLALIATWLSVEPGAKHLFFLGISLISLGIPIYLFFETYHNKNLLSKFNDNLAYLHLILEDFILPKKIIRQLISYMGDIKDKLILEYGCSVGTLTLELEKAGALVIAVDGSLAEIKILKKRLTSSRVRIIHDPHHHKRIHPLIPEVEGVISVGMLGYLSDINKLLTQLNKIVKPGSSIVFMDYDNMFKIFPNASWLKNNSLIKEIFTKHGFRVEIIRKKGLLWDYIIIKGIKTHSI